MLDHEAIAKAVLIPVLLVSAGLVISMLLHPPQRPRLFELVVRVDGGEGRSAEVIVRSSDGAEAERLAAGVARRVAESGTVTARVAPPEPPQPPPVVAGRPRAAV